MDKGKKFRDRKKEDKTKIIKGKRLYCHELNESKDISRQDLHVAIGLRAVLQIEKAVYRYSSQSEIYNSINKLQKITSCLTMQQHTYTLKVGMHLAQYLKEFVKINNLLI